MFEYRYSRRDLSLVVAFLTPSRHWFLFVCLFYFFVCGGCFACVPLYAHRGLKRVLDPLRLGLESVVSCCVEKLGRKPSSSRRAALTTEPPLQPPQMSVLKIWVVIRSALMTPRVSRYLLIVLVLNFKIYLLKSYSDHSHTSLNVPGFTNVVLRVWSSHAEV